jgi:arylsulfatase
MSHQGAPVPDKPNILYIFTDQMRGDCLSALSDSEVITPHLDRLAAEGVTFTNCQSNAPLCVPARTALMTGQLPRENGIWSNRSHASEHGPSHVRNVAEAGYETAIIGKTHLWRHSASGKRGLHVGIMKHNLEGWGFDASIEVNDPIETAWMDCYYTDDLAAKGLLDDHREFIMNWVKEAYQNGDPAPWNQVPAPVPEGEDIDSFVGRRSVEWLAQRSRDKPFYLQVQFTGPHDPYDGPDANRSAYDPSEIDPGILPEDHPRLLNNIRGRWQRAKRVAAATTEQRQNWRVNYYANISLIDEWVGKLVDVLETTGELQNTWIVFTSDHGEMLGDHGLWSKAVWYEQAVHVPCMVRPADGLLQHKTGWQSTALIEQLDVPATVLDIAGAQSLTGSLGCSLLPYVAMSPGDAAASTGKEAVLSELFGETTVITDDYKLTVKCEDDKPRQLFDLNKDPNEQRNVVEEPGYAADIEAIVRAHLDPVRHRINNEQLSEYRDYVRETGSVN